MNIKKIDRESGSGGQEKCLLAAYAHKVRKKGKNYILYIIVIFSAKLNDYYSHLIELK